jgi:hypothetical protein
LFRRSAAVLEVLLGHPGGPFWQNTDDGAWSIPDEAALSAARREFVEETGHDPDGNFLPLGEARQAGGKVVLKATGIPRSSAAIPSIWNGRCTPDAVGPFRKSTARLGSLSLTRDGKSLRDKGSSSIVCLKV